MSRIGIRYRVDKPAADSDNWGDSQGDRTQQPLTLRHRCGRDMAAASGQIPMASNRAMHKAW
ncbi:MAG: hypothetical protein QOH50_1811 [Kribbellaceae bacterium]|nr:hypothetical protein [Kribbellaceae bacterium]